MNHRTRPVRIPHLLAACLAGCAAVALAAPGDLLLKIENPEPHEGDEFGVAVAVSGNRILVGSRGDDLPQAGGAGAAYLFDATTGGLIAKIPNPDPDSNDFFGRNVSPYGEDFVVGSPADDVLDTVDLGSIHFYRGDDGDFFGTIRNPRSGGDSFGTAIAETDFNVIVGAQLRDSGSTQDSGGAYLFAGFQPTVVRVIENPVPQTDARFGASVVSLGGSYAIAAPRQQVGGTTTGTVYVYSESGALTRTIPNPEPDAGDTFGIWTAAVRGNLVVAAPLDDAGANDAGSVYVFDPASGALLSTIRNPSPGVSHEFGRTVANLAGDILVAAPGVNGATLNQGRLLVYDGETFARILSIPHPEPEEGDQLGWMAVAARGTDIVAGARNHTASGVSAGVVYVFEGPRTASATPSPTPTISPTRTPSPSPTPTVTATPAPTGTPGPTPSPTPAPASLLGNISTRGFVGVESEVMIAGLIVEGTEARRILIAGIGPNLADLGVPGALADPTLALLSGPTVLSANDNWMDSPDATDIMATGLAPVNVLESAILATLAPGEYTAILSGAAGGTGVGLVQAFDVGSGDARLGNISTRISVGTAERVMIGGFIVEGSAPKRVVVRALGPTLGLPPFDVPGAMADPELAILEGQTVIHANGNWMDDPAAGEVSSLGFAPNHAEEAALVRTLAPGAYTAIVSGAAGGSGTALIEVYDVD